MTKANYAEFSSVMYGAFRRAIVTRVGTREWRVEYSLNGNLHTPRTFVTWKGATQSAAEWLLPHQPALETPSVYRNH